MSHQPLTVRQLRYPLILLALAGLVICMWQAAQLTRTGALNDLRRDAGNELRLSAAGLEGYLSRHDYLPELLASREVVKRFLASPQTQDAAPLNRLLDRFRATADVSDIYLLDRHANTLAASNWQRPTTFIGENFAYRPYFQLPMREGRNGRFFGLGTTSGERGYYFSAPVWLEDTAPSATPDGVMVVKVTLDRMENSWAEQDAELLITDARGVVFLASQSALRLSSLRPLDGALRQALLDSRRYGNARLPEVGHQQLEQLDAHTRLVRFDTGPLHGQTWLGMSRPMPDFDWTMHILKPLTPVTHAQLIAALLAGGLYGLVMLAGGIGWQRWRLRRERERFAERENRNLAKARDELERNVKSRTQDLTATNRRLSAEIDERRRAERRLRKTQDELIQAAKLAVLGQLAAGINHELNQPLSAIRAYAENARAFLQRQRLDTADANLAQIIELTQRMAAISAQLRQFSRKSGDNLTRVSVTACFDYALRLFYAKLTEQSVRVERHWPDEDIWVRADPVRLEQVLVNLIGNALLAMAETPAPCLQLGIEQHADEVHLLVSDNGAGIASERLGNIFEPFYTTRGSGTGLGLGLSISARIIEDLNGYISAANRPTGGACFTVRLPHDLSLPVTAPEEDVTPHG
jgi:two-component system C4-dicarboxylate transport sensor histidine kinase DctB